MERDLKQQQEDFNRGRKDRQRDIEIYGEDYVNRYPYKRDDGVRYNVMTADEMFELLKKQAEMRGIK
ncbi:MAG: hypothetical protein ACLRFN_01075 [Alphaproteobacteria bacterium]